MATFQDHPYFRAHDIYPESDGDIGAKTFYLVGFPCPRVSSKKDLMAIVERLHELKDMPTWDNIELAAGELGIYTF